MIINILFIGNSVDLSVDDDLQETIKVDLNINATIII